MLLNGILTLSVAAVAFAGPLVLRSEPPAGSVFIPCEEDTKDPICLTIKRPSQDIITTITHTNGTVEVKKNLYTRAQLNAITLTFSFAWGQTQGISDTRTCQLNYVENGCHSIWYQPLMAYHNGWPNYQTHTHCSPGWGEGSTDSCYDHNWAWANVNQAVGGVTPGNLGCNSGCSGSDYRQCDNGNQGGSLWPNPN
ncbi:hypothetical protein NQ176_g5237 [Zarea fungicola]|uniref:Uncharacterized protein n=1 Tax=Zarea fungicola TaxID=93591 RepID=A0ACC1NAJ6_9HYPO|nr:hypothetical protein NQ176_g5237 [Lecanicillium fungicola]